MGLILIDSSIWIDHFRKSNPALGPAIAEGGILQHTMVTAELALGSIPQRAVVLAMLQNFEQAKPIDEARLLERVEEWNLAGTGIGFVDAHLLCSAAEHSAAVWTSDRRLAVQAERLGLLLEQRS